MVVTDIKSIRELYKKLKKERIVLTYEEFSERVGYHRTYISRVLNGHEDLTPDILEKINGTNFYERKNVSSPKDFTTKEHLAAIRAAIKILTLSVVDLKVKTSKGETTVAEITLELEKMMKQEAERILNEGA